MVEMREFPMRAIRSVIHLMCAFAILSTSRATVGQPAHVKSPSHTHPARPFQVVGYLPDYRLATFNSKQLRYLTDLNYFSVAPTATGSLDTSGLQPQLLLQLRSETKSANVRLCVTVGGWNRSAGFAPMTSHAKSRTAFIINLLKFCRQYDLDGVDYDWEGPADQDQQRNYTALIKETAIKLSSRGITTTVALGSGQYLDASTYRYVAGVNLMSYDHPGEHSTFTDAKIDVQNQLAHGAPAALINLGIPFYARDVTHFDTTVTYSDIVARYHPTNAANRAGPLYFNGPDTVKRKTIWAQGRHLGGVMVWEVGQDTVDTSSLLATVHTAISHYAPAKSR